MMESKVIGYAMASRKDCKIIPHQDLYVIHGAQDRLAAYNQYEGHGILNGHFFDLQNAGHMSHIESPQELIEVLKIILDGSTSNSNARL